MGGIRYSLWCFTWVVSQIRWCKLPRSQAQDREEQTGHYLIRFSYLLDNVFPPKNFLCTLLVLRSLIANCYYLTSYIFETLTIFPFEIKCTFMDTIYCVRFFSSIPPQIKFYTPTFLSTFRHIFLYFTCPRNLCSFAFTVVPTRYCPVISF